MTDYSPSPELVEAVARTHAAETTRLYCIETHSEPSRIIANRSLTAAVAFRHPDGHPELVPWDEYTALLDDCIAATERMQAEGDRLREQVRELVAAAREGEKALGKLCAAAITVAPCLYTPYPDAPTLTPWSRWLGPAGTRGHEARRRLRAALAPFTQEPKEVSDSDPSDVTNRTHAWYEANGGDGPYSVMRVTLTPIEEQGQ